MSIASLSKRTRLMKQERVKPTIILTDEDKILKKRLEGSFHEFVSFAWPAIEAVPFVDGWHVKAVCDHLEKAYSFDINSLIINVPPGTMKSTIMSMFNAWCWTKEPHLRFLCVSGTKRLAVKDADRCKQIIESEQYQRLWGDTVQFRRDSKSKLNFQTTAHGHRLSYSMGASVRGEGGNFVIIDDGNTDQEYISDLMREAKNEYVDSSLYLRLRDPKKSCLINVQQRIHQFDITGHMLAKDKGVVHLRLPMEYETDDPCQTVTLKDGKVWKDPRTEPNQLLWPERIDNKALTKMKLNLGTAYNIAGQLQQRPSPKHGGIIKRDWFKAWKYESSPHCEFVLQSWDTALVSHKDSCYSACSTWGVFRNEEKGSEGYGYNNIILLNTWRGKLEYPDLKEMIKRSALNYLTTGIDKPFRPGPQPDIVVIEKAASGFSLIQDLLRSGIHVIGFDPKRHGFKTSTGTSGDASKVGRAKIASSLIQQGFVWLPYRPPEYRQLYANSQLMMDSCIHFPRGDGLDLVDSMSQAFITFMKDGWLSYKGMHPEQETFDWMKTQDNADELMEIRKKNGL